MTLNGIDVSGWQAGINLAAVPADFVLIKATGGTGFVSPAANAQYAQAKSLGKLRGVYHFAREAGYRGTATQEADHFVSSIKGFLDGETILVLDWEGDNTHDVAWALAWLNRVYALTGVRPLIYMSGSVTHEVDWSPVVKAGYGLWVAAYALGYTPFNGYGAPAGPSGVGYWPFVAMWQYTSTGRLPGWNGNLDLNVFYGDRAAWLKYAAKNGAVKAPAPAPKPAPAPAPKPAPKPAPAGTYTVKGGDSLSAIAAAHGTTWQALAKLNGIANPNVIRPGQVLKLTGASAPATFYTVRAGDSLSAIAARYGTSWQALAKLNGLANPNVIYPGQRLRVR
ncbi:endolysin [Arthrobacter phage Tuck]|uniref:lysozyme n=1 Tax=Arthrobacter phage Tuck TaxID=2998996 RepID=A0A9E8S521_9CAUD|nr:endolysin [Arthrobacter phage Tuck]